MAWFTKVKPMNNNILPFELLVKRKERLNSKGNAHG